VQLAKQEDKTAAPNDHPISMTAGEVVAMLEGLQLRYANEETDITPVSIFTKEEIDNLGTAIATGLDRATPSQDVIFHVIGTRQLSRGTFARRSRVSAGRVFYRDGKFNMIFGQVQTPHRKKNVYGQVDQDFYPRNYGSRRKATKHDVVLLTNNAASLTRDDWVVIEPDVAVAAAPAAAQPGSTPQPTPASSATPTVTAVTAGAAAAGSTDKTMEQAAGTSTDSAELTATVEERLETLKRLRDRELISEEAYQSKIKEILQEL
jgi:hypothetical protein